MISEIVSTHLEAFRVIVTYDFLSEKLEFDIVVRTLASQLMVTRFSHPYLSVWLGFERRCLVYPCVSVCLFVYLVHFWGNGMRSAWFETFVYVQPEPSSHHERSLSKSLAVRASKKSLLMLTFFHVQIVDLSEFS